jgi:hypothetical protein|nr:MAG TPA: hypothetical protein [Caudoviricetes sp.]
MALFRQCRFVIYKSRKDGRGDKKMKREYVNTIKGIEADLAQGW